jgi:hypothetical protein
MLEGLVLERLLENGLLIELYAEFIGTLVLFQRFDKLDSHILNLPKDHPIFGLSLQTLDRNDLWAEC